MAILLEDRFMTKTFRIAVPAAEMIATVVLDLHGVRGKERFAMAEKELNINLIQRCHAPKDTDARRGE